MFDYVYVDKSLILPFIEGQGFETDINYRDDKFFSFQTKDLDNALIAFFIDKEGNFYYEKRNEIYVPPTEEEMRSCKSRFCFGDMKEISPPENITDNRSCYFEFYDFFETKDENVSIYFIAHVRDGKLQEPLKLKSLEKTCLIQERINAQNWQNKWTKVRSTWQWKLADLMRIFSYKIKRFILPVTKTYDSLESSLRDSVKNKYLNE